MLIDILLLPHERLKKTLCVGLPRKNSGSINEMLLTKKSNPTDRLSLSERERSQFVCTKEEEKFRN
jgi:hypothetical protein